MHLHSRLTPDFLQRLLNPLLVILASATPPTGHAAKDNDKDKEKEDKDRIVRQRPVLRIVAELAVLHAWPEGVTKGTDEVMKVLRVFVGLVRRVGRLSIGLLTFEQMTGDPQFNNMPLIAAFLKHFGRMYLGSPSRHDGNGTEGKGAESEALPTGVEELVPANVQDEFRKAFVAYFNGASKTLVKGQVVGLVNGCVGGDWETLLSRRVRNCSSRTSATMKPISARARSLRTDNTHTSE